MALHITNSRVEELARKLAKERGETLTTAIERALEERIWQGDNGKRKDIERRRERIEQALRKMDSLPVLDPRTPDEILGYDANGVPT